MEDIYSSLDDVTLTTENIEFYSQANNNDLLQYEEFALTDEVNVGSCSTTGSEIIMSDVIKYQIANHPRYPDLVSAYILCQKVGVPPEMAMLLEEIGRENQPTSGTTTTTTTTEIGADPELDEFMESYCEVLHKYKEELSRPFDEATTFLSNIESQLSNLCKGGLTNTTASSSNYHSDEAVGTSEEEDPSLEVEASESQESLGPQLCDQELKEMLLRKYGSYLSTLRKEFLKKRKKGKLPKDAKTALVDWWNTHYRWPYPTEEEKMMLAEVTGLDLKQINNWFINQRKRHWKPFEDVRFALMEGVTSNNGGGQGTANDKIL